VTIDNAANDPNVIVALLISIGIGMLLVLPALYYLLSVFKLPNPVPGVQKKEESTPGEVSKE
jgi:cytochrome bd-type quinol oxidase subunit 2